jgi:large subunit ribosomal protein L4e
MKTDLISLKGEKVKQIELPTIFSFRIREDILKKAFETEKMETPYGPNYRAGRRHSASGVIKHLRHAWKSGYGKGMSRVPRKTMWRRGTQFYWIGAEISSARGGRRAHPPKVLSRLSDKKMNKKEFEIAYKSAIAGTASEKGIKKRYSSLSEIKINNFPIIIESKIEGVKSKDIIALLKKLLPKEVYNVAIPKKEVRAGKGKLRNRKYKKTRGIILITGENEKVKTKTIETKKLKKILISDLYPVGRLAIFTEKAINELGVKNDN